MRKTNYKILFLLGAAFLLFVSSVSAVLTTGTIYDSFEAGVYTGAGSNWFLASGSVLNATNESYEGNKSLRMVPGAQIATNNSLLFASNITTDSIYAFSFGAYNENYSADSFQISFKSGVTACFYVNAGLSGGRWSYYDTGWRDTGVRSDTGTADIDRTWNNVTFIINNVNNSVGMRIGSNATGIINYSTFSLCAGGYINNISIESTTADYNNVDYFTLWNYTTYGWTNPLNGTPATVFDVYVIEAFNDTAIENVNVTFSNATNASICSVLTNAAGLASCSENVSTTELNFSAAKAGYFNTTSGVVNSSSSTAVSFIQAIYRNLTIYTVVTNETITPPFNITITGGKTYSLNGTETSLYLIPGTLNFTFWKYGWYNFSFLKNVSSYDNTTEDATGAYDAILNITPRNLTNNASITDATIYNLTQTTYSYSENYNTSAGSKLFYLLKNLTYDFNVSPENHENKSYEDVNLTANYTTYYTYHYTKNSISFRFYDEINFSTVNWVTIYVELISDIYSDNTSTSNGTLYIDLLTPTEYFIRYRATGYGTRFYPITIEEKYHYEVNLSLLANTSGSDVTINVYDTLGQTVEGAYVKIQKYDVLTNSYLLNQVGLTNFEGQTNARLILNEEFYKFIIEYEGTVVYSTDPTYVYSTTLNFYIPIDENYFNDYLKEQNLGGNITHSYTTHTSTFTYNDLNNLASGGCIYVYEYPGMTLYNSSCGITPSATLYVGVSNATEDTYLEKGYVTYAGNDYLVSTNTVTYTTNAETGATGYILAVLLIMVVVFVGFWNIEVAILLGSLVPLLFSITGLFNLSYAVTIPIFAVGIVLTFIVGGKQ